MIHLQKPTYNLPYPKHKNEKSPPNNNPLPSSHFTITPTEPHNRQAPKKLIRFRTTLSHYFAVPIKISLKRLDLPTDRVYMVSVRPSHRKSRRVR